MKIIKVPVAICILSVCAALSVRAQDNPAQTAARAALMEMMTNQPAATSTNPPAILVDASGAMVVSTATSDNAAQAKARAALEKKMMETEEQTPAQPEMPKPTANYPGKELGLNPILAPAPPISLAQQLQLDTLLAKYRADQVTPEQYQQQRAAILSKP